MREEVCTRKTENDDCYLLHSPILSRVQGSEGNERAEIETQTISRTCGREAKKRKRERNDAVRLDLYGFTSRCEAGFTAAGGAQHEDRARTR